jgi:hypothetical protein
MNQQAKNRTLGQRFADWQWGKHTKLPAPRTDYTTTYDVRIPMRDGVELLANLLEPKGKASGTVLVTSPYGINMVGQAMTGGFMARRGYRVLLVKCRGTFGSGGTFEPFAPKPTAAPSAHGRRSAASGPAAAPPRRSQPRCASTYAGRSR